MTIIDIADTQQAVDGQSLVRLRHPENMLTDEGEHEVVRYRSDPVQPGFAELALDVVFLGESKAAMGLAASVAI